MLVEMCSQKGIHFSKVASLDNECDLTSTDFLSYMAEDKNTRLVGAYLEGIRNLPRFLAASYLLFMHSCQDLQRIPS